MRKVVFILERVVEVSQRIIRYKNFEALAGWDKPLQWFFLIVEDIEVEESDEYLFSNLRRNNPGMTLDEIESKITEFEIPIPPTFRKDLELDKAGNVGNSITVYNFDNEKNLTSVDT